MSLPVLAEPRSLTVRESDAPVILEAQFRELAVRPYRGAVQRSVILPAGLLAVAILGTPLAAYVALVWSSR